MPTYSGIQGYEVGRSYYGQTNHCGVVAVAVACGKSIGKAYHTLKHYGRPDNKGTPWDALWATLKRFGYQAERLQGWSRCTVSRVTDHLPSKGTYLCYTRGHIFCVRDGEVVDWTEGRRHIVKYVWQVTPLG